MHIICLFYGSDRAIEQRDLNKCESNRFFSILNAPWCCYVFQSPCRWLVTLRNHRLWNSHFNISLLYLY